VHSVAYVRKIFRGQDFGVVPTSACYKSDWKLIPRAEEHKYLNAVKNPPQPNCVPEAVPFPPLLEHFIKLERQQKGQPADERPMLPIKSVLVRKPNILPAS